MPDSARPYGFQGIESGCRGHRGHRGHIEAPLFLPLQAIAGHRWGGGNDDLCWKWAKEAEGAL
jgi:hypothetical protein